MSWPYHQRRRQPIDYRSQINHFTFARRDCRGFPPTLSRYDGDLATILFSDFCIAVTETARVAGLFSGFA
jgi:hypothetical protein